MLHWRCSTHQRPHSYKKRLIEDVIRADDGDCVGEMRNLTVLKGGGIDVSKGSEAEVMFGAEGIIGMDCEAGLVLVGL